MSNVAGKAYGMNVLTPVSPSRIWVQRLIFMAGRAFPSTLKGLLGLSLIHFARWVIIKRNQWPEGDRGKPQLNYDYVLFCSNFNGTWDQYIDAFSDGIPQGLDLFWYASFKYPHSIPITAFKNYIVHNQFDTGYYYNATPGSAQRDIKAALKVYAELKALAAKSLDTQSFTREYNMALARVQNCLGSPGYAPIASLDTETAEQNRSKFLRSPDREPAPRAAPRAQKSSPSPATTTFDGGHCFLTVLLPVKTCEVVNSDGMRSSHVYLLREALAMMPTAHQSKPTEAVPANSPFADSARTHFARMAVIDDAIYNGPIPSDTIYKAARDLVSGTPDGAVIKPVDQLPSPYLLFSVDCDAVNEGELQDYLCELWELAGPRLAPVLVNCCGFKESVTSAESFATYMCERRVETTMPFNDYWTEAPALASLSFVLLAFAALAAGALWATCLYFALDQLGLKPEWTAGGLLSGIGWVVSSIGVALYAAYLLIITHGRRPFAQAPNSDLKSVLKALYVQRQLIQFAVAQQKPSAPDLFDAFRAFVNRVELNNLDRPTQKPGTISGIRT
jgi:hypothetical protein